MTEEIQLKPPQLLEIAIKAHEDMENVDLSPKQVEAIAHAWNKDKEKIVYLEGLLTRRASCL